MSHTPSPNGRHILVAVVTGTLGEAIQAWRREHDPRQAHRLPPHATLCYWAPSIERADALDRQIHHAFPASVIATLGGVHEFENRDGTFSIEVNDTDALDAARIRLFDGSFCALAGLQDFTWHVTCVRYPRESQREALRNATHALTATLAASPTWTIDTIAWLLLRDGVYEPLRTWTLPEAALPQH